MGRVRKEIGLVKYFHFFVDAFVANKDYSFGVRCILNQGGQLSGLMRIETARNSDQWT